MNQVFAEQRAFPLVFPTYRARSSLLTLTLITPLLIGLPLLGVMVHPDLHLANYTRFHPPTLSVVHAPFSWTAFLLLLSLIGAAVGSFVVRGVQVARATSTGQKINKGRFPWWAHVGLALGVLTWVVAWTRFDWFSDWQIHTFTPLWICYVVTVNGLTYRRSGRCMMTHNTSFFGLLFVASAAFWWFFEYLNRFVQNWYYVGSTDITAAEYFWFATLPFATVLPAVFSTLEWLRTFPVFQKGFDGFAPLPVVSHRGFSMALLLLSCAGLAGIGIYPDLLFPLLWVAPLFLIVSLQTLMGQRTVLHKMAAGDWNIIAAAAVACLICGFCWEMWNSHSLARWIYSIPYVHTLKLFEMPLLGYAGYLPFGVECLVIGDLLHRLTFCEQVEIG